MDRLDELVADIAAPMLEFRSKDPEGFDRWKDAVRDRLRKEGLG